MLRPVSLSVVETAGDIPLVVDLDGTLVRTDMLVEGYLSVLSAHPLRGLLLLRALAGGKAAFKAAVSEHMALDPALLPYDGEVLAAIDRARAEGRRVFLATAADRRVAEAVAGHLGLFDGVFASDGAVNLAGDAKAARLEAEFGPKGFDYIGNDTVDLQVWDRARTALVANGSAALVRAAHARHPDVRVVSSQARTMRDYAKALRVHQWLKNLLLFVPALAAHDFGAGSLGVLLLAFACFSLCASSVYLLNDLLDLKNDRDHPTKRRRPFARGAIPALHGMVAAPALLLLSILGALLVSPGFTAVLGAYYVLTLLYSLKLKRMVMLDVVTLAGLYGIRVVAGAVALSIALSHWLVGFAVFLFLCLALVKRATELVAKLDAATTELKGRGYAPQDLPVVEAMAAASGFVGVLVLALYINSPQVAGLYGNPSMLWGACVVLVYWVGRILILTRRGQMHDDPVVFAVTDKVSLASGAAMAGIVAASL